MPSPSLTPLETLFVLSLTASLPSSSGFSSLYPDIITLPLTPHIITLLQQVQDQLLTLKYKGGDAKVFIPLGTPIVKNVPADRSLLKAGTGVYIPVVRGDDGTIT